MPDTPQMPALPEPDSYCTHADSHEYDVWNAAQMHAFRAEGVREALAGVAAKLRRAGADLPAPPIQGTIESAMCTGLSMALAFVEFDGRALAAEIQPPQKADSA